MRPAQRSDWQITPMPTNAKRIRLSGHYSPEEIERISMGLIPQQMEDKWFIFYESPWLYLHRSWTGYCIYKVSFEPYQKGMRIAEAWTNRDVWIYRPYRKRTLLLKFLIDGRAGRDTKSIHNELLLIRWPFLRSFYRIWNGSKLKL